MRADFNAEATAHVLLYFMGQTQLADARPGPNRRAKAFSYRYFSFPDEADVYNVGENNFRAGRRNPAYLNAVKQFFSDWSSTR